VQPVRFGPDRILLFPVLIFLLGSLPAAGSSRLLLPLLLLPLGAAGWVLRARVVVSDRGLLVCNGLRARTHPWSSVSGIDVPRRGPARLLRHGARAVPMTALPRGRLRELLALAPVSGSDAPAGPEPT